jgi:hypothetical protein
VDHERAARRDELAANLAAVEQRLVKACAAAGRDRADVTLIAVTKTFPASDVRLLAELGVTDVAENRDQEARRKAADCDPALVPECAGLRWHFVGQLQRNKARSVVRYADAVHSVDRFELVEALAEEAAKRRTEPLDVLLQISLDEDVPTPPVTTITPAAVASPAAAATPPDTVRPPASAIPAPAVTPAPLVAGGDTPGTAGPRGGVAAVDLAALAAEIARTPALRLRGVMAVAPRGEDPDVAFARLARVAAELRRARPEALWISAGMSGDLESAIRHGATHVRVGSALLGNRWRGHGTVAG